MKPELIHPHLDLRSMVRHHLVSRSLAAMDASAKRRHDLLHSGRLDTYRTAIRAAVSSVYGDMQTVLRSTPLRIEQVSVHDKKGYRLENVLFDSFPGMQVNATVYVPLDLAPPFPAVIVCVGHSGKQFASYQLPAQFFARSGFLAVVFDPPGQQSEKQQGNDHFVDGVRCFPVGDTSSRYFIGDALRCIDYLETRPDVDLQSGVAMTGVSGGGTTTTFAMNLDDRITVAGPSCCVTPLAELDIQQCYAGCPETHMWRRYVEGIDEVDLLCASFPRPVLLMAGEHDEVFHVEDTRKLAQQVTAFYESAGVADRFDFYVDDSGHAYTLEQARRFMRFMNRWMRDDPDRGICDLDDESFLPDDYEELRCRPDQSVNMRSLCIAKANALEPGRDCRRESIREAAREIAALSGPVLTPSSRVGEPFQAWMHEWQHVLMEPETDMVLPSTFLYAVASPTAAVLHIDDRHRDRLLYRNGPLARVAGYADRGRSALSILSVDLRGWGDTAPAMFPYEISGWAGIDRYLAYTSAALGDSIMGMRIRDALAALAYLRTREEVLPDRIVLTGTGLGGIVALHVAAIDAAVSGVVVWDCPVSIADLISTEDYTWPADTFIPNMLVHYDLPDLVASIPAAVRVVNSLDGTGNPVAQEELVRLNANHVSPIYRSLPDDRTISDEIVTLLRSQAHQ
jgi:cephalosporin-C deacetylase-like acetyl esterase